MPTPIITPDDLQLIRELTMALHWKAIVKVRFALSAESPSDADLAAKHDLDGQIRNLAGQVGPIFDALPAGALIDDGGTHLLSWDGANDIAVLVPRVWAATLGQPRDDAPRPWDVDARVIGHAMARKGATMPARPGGFRGVEPAASAMDVFEPASL